MKKMFGFVTAASDLLSEENKIRYRGWYCGLCRSLGAVCGQSSRLLLNYDMAFLAMLLSSVHRLPETAEECSCPAHPLKKHLEIRTAASVYSADMNVILGYYKLMDDWHDDKNPAALAAASAYASKCHELEEKYPRQAQAISNLKIDKVTVWDSAGGDGKGSSTANFVSSLVKSLPPLQDVASMAGVELPSYLGKVKADAEKPAAPAAPAG